MTNATQHAQNDTFFGSLGKAISMHRRLLAFTVFAVLATTLTLLFIPNQYDFEIRFLVLTSNLAATFLGLSVLFASQIERNAIAAAQTRRRVENPAQPGAQTIAPKLKQNQEDSQHWNELRAMLTQQAVDSSTETMQRSRESVGNTPVHLAAAEPATLSREPLLKPAVPVSEAEVVRPSTAKQFPLPSAQAAATPVEASEKRKRHSESRAARTKASGVKPRNQAEVAYDNQGKVEYVTYTFNGSNSKNHERKS